MRRFFHPTTLFALMGFFIFYATTIPWDMAHAPTLSRVQWIPGWDSERNRVWSIPDMVQNVVLFLPYGFFAYYGLAFVRRRRVLGGAALAGLLGFLLSFLVESLQTLSETRSPAASDLMTNTLGALGGGLCAGILDGPLKQELDHRLADLVRRRPGLLIFGLYFLAIVLGSLAPFIPTLDIGLLRHNLRLFLDHPWGEKPLGALISDGVLFSALTFLAAVELPSLLGERKILFKAGANNAGLSAIVAVMLMSSLALGLEGAQMMIIGHSPGLQDAIVAIVCGAIGGGLVVVVYGGTIEPAHALGELTRKRPWLVLAFAVMAPTVRALQPFQFQPWSAAIEGISAWQFVPFWALFRNLNVSTLRNVLEAAAIYLPLGYALFALGRSPRFGFWMCLGLAELLELLQIPVANRVYDITEGVYAGVMGLAGAFALTALEELRQGRSEPRAPQDRDATIRPAQRAR